MIIIWPHNQCLGNSYSELYSSAILIL